jgi:hypothetical protein
MAKRPLPGISSGGWDFLREMLKEEHPDIASSFIDNLVNQWNETGSTNYNKPDAVKYAKQDLVKRWSKQNPDEWQDEDEDESEKASKWDTVGQTIVDNAATRGQEQRDLYESGSSAALGGLRGANDRATQQTQDAIAALQDSGDFSKDEIDTLLDGLDGTRRDVEGQSRDAMGQLEGAYDRFGSERDDATRQYLDALSPLERQLQAQGYEGISTDKADLDRLLDSFDRQGDVYGRYEELSTPEMNAKERAILDAAGRSFALKDKGARDASIRDLGDRGILSGGNLISNQVASQQQLGNERSAAMVQAQGSAVDRALAALAGMRGTAADMSSSAGEIRSGNDALLRFNKEQQGITQRFQDSYAQAEYERRQSLAQGRQDTLLSKTTGDLNAAGTLNSAQQTALDNRFNRKNSVTNTGLTATQNKYSIDQGITGEKTTAADREADRASALAGTELTDVTNRTNLVGTTGDREDEALKYQLGLESEKENLRKLGVRI